MALEKGVMLTAEAHTRALVGAAMEVHAQLGPGFLEPIYQAALAVEFRLRSIPCSREVQVPVFYKGKLLAHSYRADFVCFGNVVVELKAVRLLGAKDDAQINNYMKATGHAHGLLLNFGQRRLQFKRFDAIRLPPGET